MKHKHCELIKAWADGAEIEYFDTLFSDDWRLSPCPGWNSDIKYRIKKKPMELWINLYDSSTYKGIHQSKEVAQSSMGSNKGGRILHMIEVID